MAALVVSTARCGVDVCAMGFGDCEKMYRNAPASTTGAGGVNRFSTLTVSGNKQQVVVNETAQFTASGGSPGNRAVPDITGYRFRVEPHDGKAEINGSGVFSSRAAGTYTIYATDFSQPPLQAFTTIVVH